ncbi:hypothetical protein E0L36_04485 [Streptomyces sp. AJS327]|uniref:hypothetical protein n=1 Tax=Streptomyces sp. AJS327 TaxID=2545265 RepID=UPI0015DE7712|nr:hypothetical protein [Streptomyces sp. AJS327]MBA0050180.1 hypothetical protein [Streptomyces sp. AJS327]
MADPLYPLAGDEDLPDLGTYDAIGTMLLHNSRADESGGFFATCWFMVLLPIVPLSRYYVRQTGYRDESGLLTSRTTTTYEIVGRSRVRWTEVVRTYLLCWLVLPAVFVGPILFAVLRWDSETSALYGTFVSVGLFFLLFTLFLLYRTYWRPVREVRWADTTTGPTDGRNWQELAFAMQMAVLLGLLGFFVGVAIFFTALAMGELPTNSDPEPNPYVDTLLHPAALLAGLPVLTAVVTFGVLASRRRR